MMTPPPDPYRLFDHLPFPTEYAFLFEAVPPVLIVAGLASGFIATRKPRNLRAISVRAAAGFLLSALMIAFLGERYLLIYQANIGCLAAGSEPYKTIVPLFAPAHLAIFMPDGAQFDSLICTEFDEIMWKGAAAGMVATLAALTISTAAAAFCVGLIFAALYRQWRPAAPESGAS